MEFLVDLERRYAKQRAHTATHLLHAALQQFFPSTKQEGSYVGEDELRFDYAADAQLTAEQIATINTQINKYIYQALPVHTEEMAYQDAIALGAKAFFADTYGERVRVVQIGKSGETPMISVELCGGNHVKNTTDIGCFLIVHQEAVAAGIKRIVAYTGTRVLEKVAEDENILTSVSGVLGVKQSSQIVDKLDKLYKEYNTLTANYETVKKLLASKLHITTTPVDMGAVIAEYPVLATADILGYLENQSPLAQTGYVAYLNNEDGTSIVTVYDPVEQKAKEKATSLEVRGGGTDKKVTGKRTTHFGL